MKHLLVLSALIAAILSAPSFAATTPTCNSTGGSGVTSAHNGAIVIISAVDNTCILTPLPVGTAGSVLTSTGTNAAPAFAVPSVAPTTGPTATPFPGAVVPTPNATGQLISSTNGSTFSLLNIGSTGQVLTVAGGVPSWATPAASGASLSANQTFTGINAFSNTAGVSFGPGGSVDVPTAIKWGSANVGVITLGSDTTQVCGGVLGFSLALVDVGGAALTSSDGGTGICSNLSVGGAISEGGQTLNFGGPSAAGGTLLVGQSGAPSDPCVSGSIYTRSDGSVGAALYVCYGAVWHASAT